MLSCELLVGSWKQTGEGEQIKEETQRCVRRLSTSLAPVCGCSELMCHPDPEGADSRAGKTRPTLPQVLGTLCIVGFVLFWPKSNTRRKEVGSISNITLWQLICFFNQSLFYKNVFARDTS